MRPAELNRKKAQKQPDKRKKEEEEKKTRFIITMFCHQHLDL